MSADEKPKAVSKTSSPRRPPSAISTAIAACSRTAATTSTISRATRRSRRSATCCGTAGCRTRRARRSAVAAGRGAPAAGADPAADEACCRPSDGMDALRTLTSALGHYDPDAARQLAAGALSQGGSADRADRAASSRPSGRMQAGRRTDRSPIRRWATRRTSSTCSPASRPNALATRAFDIALMLHADHELNASTFAARVAAATLTDMHSAIVAAIGTLKGPLHGGANAEVMQLLIEIGQDAPPERIDEAIRAQAGAEGEDPGLRPPRLQHRGPARDAPAPDVEGARRARRQHARGSRCRSASSSW